MVLKTASNRQTESAWNKLLRRHTKRRIFILLIHIWLMRKERDHQMLSTKLHQIWSKFRKKILSNLKLGLSTNLNLQLFSHLKIASSRLSKKKPLSNNNSLAPGKMSQSELLPDLRVPLQALNLKQTLEFRLNMAVHSLMSLALQPKNQTLSSHMVNPAKLPNLTHINPMFQRHQMWNLPAKDNIPNHTLIPKAKAQHPMPIKSAQAEDQEAPKPQMKPTKIFTILTVQATNRTYQKEATHLPKNQP